MKVLLIEDDIQLNTTITNFLQLNDYEVVSLSDGEEAIITIDEVRFDIYIIDINLPNVNGIDIVKYIRQKDTVTPIVIITASLELDNFKEAFKSGCDEYIKKPFYLEELEIRINNLISKVEENNLIHIADNIVYDMANEELSVDNKIVNLRKKEKRLLSILLKNVNRTVSTEIIQDYVWENEIKESYPLRQLMSDLKQKVCKNYSYIVTQKGIGYRFEIIK